MSTHHSERSRTKGNILPRVVLILVHGTFARGAAWAKQGSFFREHLVSRLSDNIAFKPFKWSGANSHRARILASRRLDKFIKRSLRTDPLAFHVVIAHSHGGNVILYALKDASLAERIDGIICMATPFIGCKPRKWLLPVPYEHPLFVRAVAVMLSVPPVVLTLRAFTSPSPFGLLDLSANFADIAYVALLFAIYRVGGLTGLKDWFTASQESLRRLLLFPEFDCSRLFVISVRGDEAFWWLQRLTRWSEFPFFVWEVACWLFAFGLLGPLMLACFSDISEALPNIVAWCCGLVALTVVMLVLLLLMLVMPYMVRGRRLGFGDLAFTDSLIARIDAYPIPYTAFLSHFSSNYYRSKMGLFRPLRHSFVYNDPVSLGYVIRWINRLTVSEFARGPSAANALWPLVAFDGSRQREARNFLYGLGGKSRQREWRNLLYGLIGWILTIAILLALVLFLVIAGGISIASWIEPTVAAISTFAILIGVPIAFVLLISRLTREWGAFLIYILRWPLGVWLWLACLIYAMRVSEFWAIAGVLMGGVGVIPVAAVMMHSQRNWRDLAVVVSTAAFLFLSRRFALWIARKLDEERYKAESAAFELSQ